MIIIFLYCLNLQIDMQFSCPQKSDLADSSECYVVHYSLLSCAIWMLATVVFIRFSAMVLLCALLIAFLLYSLHVFVTHPMLYIGYSQITQLVYFL